MILKLLRMQWHPMYTLHFGTSESAFDPMQGSVRGYHRFWSCLVCHGTITSHAVLRPLLVITLPTFLSTTGFTFQHHQIVPSVVPLDEKHMKFRSHMPTVDVLLGSWLVGE